MLHFERNTANNLESLAVTKVKSAPARSVYQDVPLSLTTPTLQNANPSALTLELFYWAWRECWRHTCVWKPPTSCVSLKSHLAVKDLSHFPRTAIMVFQTIVPIFLYQSPHVFQTIENVALFVVNNLHKEIYILLKRSEEETMGNINRIPNA